MKGAIGHFDVALKTKFRARTRRTAVKTMLKRVWAPDESSRVEIGLLDDALAQQQRHDRALKGAIPPSNELAAAGAHPHETTAFPSYPEASEAAAPPRVLPSDCILEQLCAMSFPVGLSLHAAALHPTSINAALNWAVNNSKRTDSPMFFPASLHQRDEWAAAAAGVGPSEACRLESLERVVAHACTAPSLQHLLKDSRVALSASASRVIHALLQWKVRSIVLDSVAPPPPSHPLMAISLLEQALSPIEHAIKRHIPAGFACVHSAQFRKLMAAVHYCNGLGLGGSKCHYSGLPCWCKTDLKVRGSPPLIACVQVSSQVFPGILQNDILMPSDVLQLQALLLLVACQALASKMLEAADAALKRALPSQFNDPLYDFDILDAVATDELLNEAFPNCKDFKGLEHEQLQQQQCLTQVQEQHRVLYQQKLNDHAQQQQKLQEQEAAQRALLSRQLKQQQEQLQERQRQQIAREEEHKRLNENQCNTQQSHVQQQRGHSATVHLVHTAPNIESISVMQHFTSLPDNQYMCNHCGSCVRSRAYHLKRYHGDATAPTQPISAIPHANTAPRADLHAAVECMAQQVEAAVDNVPVPTELQKPLECAAGQFCPHSNTAASGACPAGCFCPYASLGPSPTASAINAKRKQMDEVEQQMQNPASMVASMISSVADATLSADKKRRKVCIAANTDSCSTFTAWNSFAALPMFPKFEHDCTERALLSLLPTLQDQQTIESFLPHASRSEKCDQWMQSRATQQNEPRSFSSAMLDFIQGERVWDPSSRADFVGVDAAIPGIYRSFVVVSAERVKKFSACTVKLPFHQLNQSKTAVDKNRHCMQVKQRVLCHINVSLLSCSSSHISHFFSLSASCKRPILASTRL
jgi:ferredoxin